MNQLLLKSEIKAENDIVWSRKKSRQLAEFLKLDNQSQIRLATAVSEITRNAFQYAGSGTITFQISEELEKIWIVIDICDKGPGIENLDQILKGNYVSRGGMGVGVTGAKKLVDEMLIETKVDVGTKVTLKKCIPLRRNLLSQLEIKTLVDTFMKTSSNDPIEEVKKQNQEILLTMSELQEKKAELILANQALEDTNKGILALYAELDEKVEHLRVANESKTIFLSDMTHEFRSPLNSISSISQFLLEDALTDKAAERELQIRFIIKASDDLSTLVNDLLDIAKIEAGKVQIRAAEFSLKNFLRIIKGLLAPLNKNNVQFTVVEITEEKIMYTDEVKLTQILRNLISNALKYTEKGSVTLTTAVSGDQVTFSIIDTGIGIAEENIEDVFSEFKQIHHPLQSNNKGTGLGLPLAVKLTNLLKGSLHLESKLNSGSTFSVIVPMKYVGPEETKYLTPMVVEKPADKQLSFPLRPVKILMVDDDKVNRYEVHRMIKHLPIEYREASDGQEALEITKEFLPDMIILDFVMPKLDGAAFIKLCQANEKTAKIAIFLYTSKDLTNLEKQEFEKVIEKIVVKNANGPAHILEVVQNFIGKNNRTL